MLDPAITDFLENKKQDYLKKKIKSNTSEDDKQLFIQEAQEKYNLENWLLNASKRAKQISLSSHPAKFVHPDAKVSSIITDAKMEPDGLLRSGNVEVELDVFGNAAALDVEKFLRIQLHDQRTILQHLEENSDWIKSQFKTETIPYEEIREDFLQIKHSDLNQTSEKLKQIYFPADDNYHLLSTLIPSGMIFKLKQRINELRFSNENQTLREELKKAKPEAMNGKISEIYGLTAIGYGGTQSQNISIQNAQNGGNSFLLSSLPPQLAKRPIQPPKQDFFENCLWPELFKNDFEQFHNVLSWRKNNLQIRDKRDDIVLNSITKITRLVHKIRDISVGWSDSDTYHNLPLWQKIWLDDRYADIRKENKQNHDYLNLAQSYFANWFIGHYKQAIKDNKLLGDDDIDHIKTILKQEQGLLE
jgi:CRISPR-associated protein Csy1